MSSISAEVLVRRSFQPSFYFWIVLGMAFFIFGGFSLAALERYLTHDPRTMPPVVHLHGVTFISWMTLLVIQAWLINVKNVKLHRSLGTLGVAIGTAIVFTGSLITLLAMHTANAGSPAFYDLMYLSVVAVVGFAFLFTVAISQARNPENHRRLILFATIPLLPPGINRMYQVLFQLDIPPVFWTYLTMAAIATAILVHDRRTTGRINAGSKIGAAVVFGEQLLHIPIARSDAFAALTQFLGSLVYYR